MLQESLKVRSSLKRSMLLEEPADLVQEYTRDDPGRRSVIKGAAHQMLELTYVGPEAAVFADTVTTDVAGYGD